MAIKQLSDGAPEGTVLGQSGDKIAFFGAAPSAQMGATTPPAATAATNSTPYGFAQAQADAIVTWIRAVDAELKAKGFIKS